MPVTSNIARHLPLMAEQAPDAPAIKIPRGRNSEGRIDYLCLSFAELEAEAEAWQQRLRAAGVRRGDRTLVMVRPGLPLIASIFALFAMGAVPVIIDPGMGLKSFFKCVKRSRPRVLLAIRVAQILSHVFRGTFSSVQVRVSASSNLDACLSTPLPVGTASKRPRLMVEPTLETDPAAILFTSGSTGTPKGVCYEHGMFEAQVRLVRATYDIQPGEVNLPLLPIFALFNPALGMTTVVPEINPSKPASVDPAKIVQAIQQEKVTYSFGSPTLWRIIGDYCLSNGLALPTMKRVLSAGAPVPASLWTDSQRFLPHGQLHSPYGATEVLPVSSVSSAEIDPSELKGAYVGKPVPGMEVRIIPISDEPIRDLRSSEPLPSEAIGEIIVKGPVVTRCYDELPEATAAAKIPDGDAIWHRMGDSGFLDASGGLWFCGRKVERVTTPEGPVFTEPCERVFRMHPRARRCALIGLGNPGTQIPAIVAETRVANSREARQLARELRTLAKQYPQTERINCFYFLPKFPVDVRHNAKIHRLSIAKWAAKNVGFHSDPKR